MLLIDNMRYGFARLLRLPYSCGFGAQSPSAFQFINYVISEKLPYYAYSDLNSEGSKCSQKMLRLYFRLANFLQAKRWLYFGNDSEIVRQYVVSGCRKTQFCSLSSLKQVEDKSVMLISEANFTAQELIAALPTVPNQCVVVIEDIYRNKSNRMLWKSILASEHVSFSFDLYLCGILFFDNRPKENFVVNF